MESEEKNKADLLPDYEVDKESLDYDSKLYTTMYPISSLRADTLATIGLKVYEIVKSDNEVKNYIVLKKSDFSFEKEYAVKKEDWRDFIYSDDGKQFVKLWEKTANFAHEILHREPIMTEDDIYQGFHDIYCEETAKCREYLKNFNNRESADFSFDLNESFHYVHVYGRTLAIEYTYILWLIETSLGRKDASLLCGYMKIVNKQYDYILDEFNKSIQKTEEKV